MHVKRSYEVWRTQLKATLEILAEKHLQQNRNIRSEPTLVRFPEMDKPSGCWKDSKLRYRFGSVWLGLMKIYCTIIFI